MSNPPPTERPEERERPYPPDGEPGCLTRVMATFSPLRTDDLRPDMSVPIGWRGVWEFAWVIDDGTYAGQWCLIAIDPTTHRMLSGWTPYCDLADVNLVETAPADVSL